MDRELRAIIIDDEEAARNVLTNLLGWSNENILVVATGSNLLNGVEEIKKHKPDVVFLDVQMPDYAGYEIVRFFDDIEFEIVFVTAFDQYAIKAFEMSALDYLVKPVERSRLNSALKRIKDRVVEKSEKENYRILKDVIERKQTDKIIISELFEGHIRQRVINVTSIVAIEAMRAYSNIYLHGGDKLLVSRNLKSFEDILPMDESFVRSHRSWLVSAAHVESYSAQSGVVQLEGGLTAKITKSNVERLKSLLNM